MRSSLHSQTAECIRYIECREREFDKSSTTMHQSDLSNCASSLVLWKTHWKDLTVGTESLISATTNQSDWEEVSIQQPARQKIFIHRLVRVSLMHTSNRSFHRVIALLWVDITAAICANYYHSHLWIRQKRTRGISLRQTTSRTL